MPSVGPVGGNAAANDPTAPAGGSNWSNVSNALTSDGLYATFTSSFEDTTAYLRVLDFGTGIMPGDATVDGIVVEIQRKTDTASVPLDHSIKLFKASAPVGSDKSTGAAWSTTEAWISFGGASDLWGTSWSPSDFDSGFGAGISVTDPSVGGWTASVNAFRITIYYTEAAGGRRQLMLLGVGP